MAAEMKAQLTLKLNDQLSDGIKALERRLQSLTSLFQKLNRLRSLGDQLQADKLTSQLAPAEGALDRVRKKAEGAAQAIRRLGEQKIMVNSAGTAFLPPSVSRGIMAAAVAAAVGAGGGGGRTPAMPSASFFGGPQPLLLAGPGGGGIPLSFNPALMQMSSLVGLTGQFKTAMGQAAGQVSALNHNLREAGHGAIAACATGFGLMHPIGEYADYEDRVRHISITQGTPMAQLPGAINEHMQEYNALALKSRQSSKEIADAAMFLLTDGLSKETVKVILPSIAMAATAYRGSVRDGVAAAFTMHQNLKVPEHEMGQAIAMLALAGRSGHVPFGDLSRLLQEVAPAAERAGMTGLAGSAKLLAMLEAVKRGGAGTSDRAAVMLKDLIDYLNSPFGSHSFAKGGIDLPKMLLDAEKKGINPVEAVMEAVNRHTTGMTRQGKAHYVGTVFHNQDARQGFAAIENQLKYYQEVEKKLLGANPDTINEDFAKADGPEAKLRLLTEKLTQIVRRFGEGFTALLDPMNATLDRVLAVFAAIDAVSPGTVNKILALSGGFLALMATLGILLPIFKLVSADFLLLDKVALLAKLGIAKFEGAMLRLLIAGGPILWILGAIALVV